MLAKRGLQGRERRVVAEPLDRHDLRALGLHRQHQAGAHRVAVDDDRTGAAHPMLTADMRAGQAEPVAQAIGEGRARLDLDLGRLAIDREGDALLRPRPCASARSTQGLDEGAAIGGAGMKIVGRIDRRRCRAAAAAMVASSTMRPSSAASAAASRCGRSHAPITPTWALTTRSSAASS